MTTIEVWRSFDWSTLTLTWHARRLDTAITPGAAIANAVKNLETQGLVVRASPSQHSARFHFPWLPFSSRVLPSRGLGWYFWVQVGKVWVDTQDGNTTANAKGSLALLFLLPLLLCAITYIKYRQGTIVVAAVLLIYVAINFVYCSDALQTLTMAAIAPIPPSRAA